MSSLTIVQVVLIIAGLTFQVVAMSWLYRDSSHDRSDCEHDSWGEKKVDLGIRRRKAGHSSVPRDSVHDYYEMEKTPPGIRPADLRKTARVKYMDDVKTTPPAEP